MKDEKVKQLQELAIWMTGCGYDFTQHDYYLQNRHLFTDDLSKQVVKDSLTTQTVEKWKDFELYDVFETAIQESALTVVTKYHNLDEETAELALECVRIFKELKGATDNRQGITLQDVVKSVNHWATFPVITEDDVVKFLNQKK